MALTHEEKVVLRSLQPFDWSEKAYGTHEDGWCPIAQIAVNRGAFFYFHSEDQAYHIGPEPEPGKTSVVIPREHLDNWHLIRQAQRDVLTWAGYEGREMAFVETFATHGGTLFPREDSCRS